MHYMGGCLLNDNLVWGSTMFWRNCRAARSRRMVGEGWRAMWLERLEHGRALAHANGCATSGATNTGKHGSVCEDFAEIQCAGLCRRRLGGRLFQRRVPRLLERI